MPRWLLIASVVSVIGVCTLVSAQDVDLRYLGRPAGYLPGYLIPLLGYLAGLAAGWMLFAPTAPKPTPANLGPPPQPRLARWVRLSLISALAVSPVIVGGLVSHEAIALSWPGYTLGSAPGFLLPFIGFGLSFGPMSWSAPSVSPPVAPPEWPMPANFPLLVAGFLIVLAVGVTLGLVGLLQATAIFAAGVTAGVLLYQVFRRVNAGESLAFESHWGGIGGGLGGWRLSPTGALVLLALVFGALTIGAAVAWPAPGGAPRPPTKPPTAAAIPPKPGAQAGPRS